MAPKARYSTATSHASVRTKIHGSRMSYWSWPTWERRLVRGVVLFVVITAPKLYESFTNIAMKIQAIHSVISSIYHPQQLLLFCETFTKTITKLL
ncbi:hypothetical protein BBOV_I003920 [Babesia bovis T2Bo]|uniref:Uncharacterized protein n=1 Tax=Babesia bovis TaxID=5865 RepID=A7AWP6_BABBO|nr:hypothetical protein BBOV_I003920 [Babesia bovis T2Bo]EDO05474.1 hypothetical protein BBOV_I003920 [Babesia bovis T2Bo]|eukprot:XP_001609042.1 hypothetical protein [Babesia bovis T2Bo]